MREFYLEAKAELGYTSSQLRQSPELKAKVDVFHQCVVDDAYVAQVAEIC